MIFAGEKTPECAAREANGAGSPGCEWSHRVSDSSGIVEERELGPNLDQRDRGAAVPCFGFRRGFRLGRRPIEIFLITILCIRGRGCRCPARRSNGPPLELLDRAAG